MQLSQCLHCKRSVSVLRKGYCGACYARYQRNGTPEYEQVNRRTRQTHCSFCSKPGTRLVRGLCKACYYREKKNGDLEYRKIPKFCTVPDCGELSVASGLCEKHYRRIRKSGSTNEPKPRGAKTNHPLYERWSWYHRNQNCDPRWDNFWNFVDDVGEPPTTTHRLYRNDESQPYGPNNFVWKERVLDKLESQSRAEYAKAWRAAYTVKNPKKFKHQYLRRYGISIEQFDEMLAKQNGVCAICGKKELVAHQATGEFRHLAVDHCHDTKKVRGLLCSPCNRGLGMFQDSADLLRRAISYLERQAKSDAA